MAVKSILNSAT